MRQELRGVVIRVDELDFFFENAYFFLFWTLFNFFRFLFFLYFIQANRHPNYKSLAFILLIGVFKGDINEGRSGGCGWDLNKLYNFFFAKIILKKTFFFVETILKYPN
jgi:hypothetical protein